MKSEIKVIENSDLVKFESEVQIYLDQGFKINSSSCGFVQSESYDFCSCYQAILIKEQP